MQDRRKALESMQIHYLIKEKTGFGKHGVRNFFTGPDRAGQRPGTVAETG